MNKEELQFIVEQQKKLKDLTNGDLTTLMDKLSSEFEVIKDSIIKQTFYLDQIKSFYDKTLEEYRNRR